MSGRTILAAAVVFFAGLIVVGIAQASPDPISGREYLTACPSADESCLALAERLEWVDNAIQQGALSQADIATVLYAHLDPDEDDVITAYEVGGGGGETTLAENDHDALNLIWWGQWATVGLLFVLILAPRWFTAFRVTRGA